MELRQTSGIAAPVNVQTGQLTGPGAARPEALNTLLNPKKP